MNSIDAHWNPLVDALLGIRAWIEATPDEVVHGGLVYDVAKRRGEYWFRMADGGYTQSVEGPGWILTVSPAAMRRARGEGG